MRMTKPGKPTSSNMAYQPLDIVGSTTFGRYPKISGAQTLNMLISDDWLVDYAGYKKRITIRDAGEGRGGYVSSKTNSIYIVVNSGLYRINSNIQASRIATLKTSSGDVFMAENNNNQLAICDKKNIYIYNTQTGNFQEARVDINNPLDFLPGYICFQGGYFISVDLNTAQWRLSDVGNGLLWPTDNTGEFQSKADNLLAIVPMPSQGNVIMILGKIGGEFWTQLPVQSFPYQKNTSVNPNYGCLNPATIAIGDKIVVWLGRNQSSGPTILVSDGGIPTQIEADGINYKFSQLKYPENSYGFLFKQDGHLIYHIAFPRDNISYIYDFNTQKFFTVTDRFYNYHIAKQIFYYNSNYYFISLNDGNFYEMDSSFTEYDGEEIPRIRICSPFRFPTDTRGVVNNVSFTIEQGENTLLQAVDLSLSKDGNVTFGNYIRKDLNRKGKRQGRLNFWDLGSANEVSVQIRFWGHGRFVANNGAIGWYQ